MSESTGHVSLRDVVEDDIEIFFQHQREPEAVAMASFPARDRETHFAHWRNVMSDESVILKTILFDDRVAGNVVSWEQDDDRFVGYWIGKEFWGKGIATRALALFLEGVRERPLQARVARDNIGSIRILERSGFVPVREQTGDDGVVEIVYGLGSVTRKRAPCGSFGM